MQESQGICIERKVDPHYKGNPETICPDMIFGSDFPGTGMVRSPRAGNLIWGVMRKKGRIISSRTLFRDQRLSSR
jgi:hypothetical protein